jgi:hypothetical protein
MHKQQRVLELRGGLGGGALTTAAGGDSFACMFCASVRLLQGDDFMHIVRDGEVPIALECQRQPEQNPGKEVDDVDDDAGEEQRGRLVLVQHHQRVECRRLQHHHDQQQRDRGNVRAVAEILN